MISTTSDRQEFAVWKIIKERTCCAGAFLFEDVGVTAVHGALPLISDKTVLSGASGIMGTEAYHGGIIRTLLFQLGNEIVEPYPYRVFGFVQVRTCVKRRRLQSHWPGIR